MQCTNGRKKCTDKALYELGEGKATPRPDDREDRRQQFIMAYHRQGTTQRTSAEKFCAYCTLEEIRGSNPTTPPRPPKTNRGARQLGRSRVPLGRAGRCAGAQEPSAICNQASPTLAPEKAQSRQTRLHPAKQGSQCLDFYMSSRIPTTAALNRAC